jgi:hypothetical protein
VKAAQPRHNKRLGFIEDARTDFREALRWHTQRDPEIGFHLAALDKPLRRCRTREYVALSRR